MSRSPALHLKGVKSELYTLRIVEDEFDVLYIIYNILCIILYLVIQKWMVTYFYRIILYILSNDPAGWR